MSLFVDLFATLDTTLQTFRGSAVTNLAGHIRTFVTAASIVTIVLIAIEMYWGGVASIKKLVGGLFMIGIVSIFSLNPDNYNAYIGNYLIALPDDLMQAIASAEFAGVGGIGGFLDTTMNDMMSGIGRIWSSAGLLNLYAPTMLAIVLFLLLLLMGAAAMISIIVGKVGISLVVALGPVFIMTLVVPGMKDFFTKWLSYALSMTILQMLIGGVMLIAKTILETYATALTDPASPVMNSPGGVMAPALIMLVLAYIFGQLPSMSSSLAGGIGLASPSPGAIAGAAMSGLKKLFQSGRNSGGNNGGQAPASAAGGGSVSDGSGGQAQNAIMRAQRINNQGDKSPQKDAPQSTAGRSSASAAALAKMQAEIKKHHNDNNNGEKK